MPLLTGLFGVGVGLLGIKALSGVVELNSSAPTLALMLGLAVGIDYTLFILSRHRQQLRRRYADRPGVDQAGDRDRRRRRGLRRAHRGHRAGRVVGRRHPVPDRDGPGRGRHRRRRGPGGTHVPAGPARRARAAPRQGPDRTSSPGGRKFGPERGPNTRRALVASSSPPSRGSRSSWPSSRSAVVAHTHPRHAARPAGRRRACRSRPPSAARTTCSARASEWGPTDRSRWWCLRAGPHRCTADTGDPSAIAATVRRPPNVGRGRQAARERGWVTSPILAGRAHCPHPARTRPSSWSGRLRTAADQSRDGSRPA